MEGKGPEEDRFIIILAVLEVATCLSSSYLRLLISYLTTFELFY
jgi:hypothetical protein